MFSLYFLYIELFLSSFVCGFATKRPFDVLSDLLKSDKVANNAEDFGDLDYIEEVFQQDMGKNKNKVNPLHNDEDESFQTGFKKSNFKPKYNPGWKFIGLGKRPLQKDGYEYSRNYPHREIVHAYKKNHPNNEEIPFHPNESNHNYRSINPLLVSSIINFEIISAIRDGIQEAARETMKKGSGVNDSRLVSAVNPSTNRFNGRFGLYGGRQKVTYDPGWMLTGLGKRSQ